MRCFVEPGIYIPTGFGLSLEDNGIVQKREHNGHLLKQMEIEEAIDIILQVT
jgi:Xaa-Pro aminopeptidase